MVVVYRKRPVFPLMLTYGRGRSNFLEQLRLNASDFDFKWCDYANAVSGEGVVAYGLPTAGSNSMYIIPRGELLDRSLYRYYVVVFKKCL